MDEMIKEWFSNLIDEEIETEEGTIDNESMWVRGDDIHSQMIHIHKKYIEFLKSIKEKYCN